MSSSRGTSIEAPQASSDAFRIGCHIRHSASWLNVEGFFAKLTRRRLKRGVFRSIVDLQAAINRFLAETKVAPKPFRWTADPNRIIAAGKRGHHVLESIH